MKRILLGLGLLVAAILPGPVGAQQVNPPVGPPGGIACAYNSALPTITSGFAAWVQCDSHGQLLVSGGGGGGGSAFTVLHASTTSLATALSAKTSSGSLLGFNCTSITGGAAGFCVAYNSASTPGTGALTGANVLDFCYFDTTARGCSLGRAPSQIAYSAGIQILVTSAASPYTYTTGTDTAAVSADYQ